MMNVKIIVMNAYDMGGIERAAFSLKSSLVKAGFNVEILSMHTNDENFYGEDVTLLEGRTEVSKLSQLYESSDESTVLISTYDRISIILLALSVFNRKKIKIIASQHADYYAHRRLVRFARVVFYPFASAIVALTKKDALLYRRIIRNNNVECIGNIVSQSREVRLSFKRRDLDVIAVGRLTPIKRFEHFIKIANQYTWKFALYGHGPEFTRLKNMAIDENLLQGASKNILEIMGQAKILLVTSERESFSMVILEAMSRGCIVISYDCPTGPGELIVDGVNGFLIENGNYQEMSRRCEEVLSGKYDLDCICNNAYLTVEKFSSRAISSKWANLMESV